MSFFTLFHISLLVAAAHARFSSIDYTQYVQPFYGTQNGGNMFPGVVPAPWSVVKVGPDVYTGSNEYSGYASTGNITGFSLMHETGTGGAPKYGTVAQLPVAGNISNPLSDSLYLPRSSDDEASVGWYKTSISNGVVTQLAGTKHAGFFKYSFPSGIPANVLIDVSHYLPDFRGMGWEQNYVNGSIKVAADGHYEGSGTYNGGWNLAPDWTIYFCGYFESNSSNIQTFYGTNTTLSYYGKQSTQSGTGRLGAVYSFSKSTVTSRVGISWISSTKACSYVNEEIPAETTIDALVSAAKDTWNSEVFSKVTSNSASSTDLGMLYTNMYGMHIIPSNRTGDMPGWSASEYYYDDWFTLWDLFRCTTSLLHIFQPTAYTEMIQGLINVYLHDGWMPDGRSSNYNGRSQGGSNADNVLADAFVKGVQVDWDTGFAALLKDAEVTPPNNYDPISPDSADNHGRGALPDWLTYGYITPTYLRAVSRAIEYSANDFGVYQVAKSVSPSSASKYLSRSRNWRNHYSNSTTSLNFTGFLVPRYSNGTFDSSYDPLQCGGCYWADPYYQATAWEYLFSPIHDMAHLVQLTGGPEPFISKLSTIFTPGLTTSNPAFNHTIINPGNEPSFASPYLFNYANRPDLSIQHSRFIARSYYSLSPSGLPGNSDAGAMQSWYLWSVIGLYPVTAQTTFLIASPWYDDLTISLSDSDSGSKTVKITRSGPGDYVRSLKVNGQQWNKAWLTWDDVFKDGGSMEFVMEDEYSGQWPGNDAERVPSPSSSDSD
ncbi:putative glycosyl family 92 protein [Phaeomoniella chlamydospora]|uniref:Putative glycosyl family 92 protein n=1 Tax=Phaeomoniella chlamydospora TaxID=158046 RepID=A0A0G2GZE6_PHACM|nr:putative glycosyl family 92 protein [Phaeomoniella chlamydospora]